MVVIKSIHRRLTVIRRKLFRIFSSSVNNRTEVGMNEAIRIVVAELSILDTFTAQLQHIVASFALGGTNTTFGSLQSLQEVLLASLYDITTRSDCLCLLCTGSDNQHWCVVFLLVVSKLLPIIASSCPIWLFSFPPSLL